MAKHAKDTDGAQSPSQTGYGWLDDAFDDEKQAEEFARAQASRNRGCLIGTLLFLVIAIAVCIIGCAAIGMLGSDLSI